MTPTEQAKMLREALTGLFGMEMLERADHHDQVAAVNLARAALAATAEPATPSHPMAGTELNQYDVDEPAPTYSADDLRKVAEAVREESFTATAYCSGACWTNVKAIDLDAIIAKAVGR